MDDRQIEAPRTNDPCFEAWRGKNRDNIIIVEEGSQKTVPKSEQFKGSGSAITIVCD